MAFNDMLKYQGFSGSIEVSQEDRCLFGKVLFIKDCIVYDGENFDELEQSFRNAVAEYLDFCKEIGKQPETSCSGSFNVRLGSELHLKCSKHAYSQNVSLNAFMINCVEYYFDTHAGVKKLSHALDSLGNTILQASENLNYHFEARQIEFQQLYSPEQGHVYSPIPRSVC